MDNKAFLNYLTSTTTVHVTLEPVINNILYEFDIRRAVNN